MAINNRVKVANDVELKDRLVAINRVTKVTKGGRTLAAASSLGLEAMPKKEQAAKVGELIAKKAIEAGITAVVFDRNGYLYHGRVKEVADAARNGGLKF